MYNHNIIILHYKIVPNIDQYFKHVCNAGLTVVTVAGLRFVVVILSPSICFVYFIYYQ